MLRIGLTGGIGAGKSTVSATFAECGGIIVDGDVIAREVVEPGTEGLPSWSTTFGEDILQPRRRAEPSRAGSQGVRRRREARDARTASCTPCRSAVGRRSLGAVHDDAVSGGGHSATRGNRDGAVLPLVVGGAAADMETRVDAR